MDNFVKLRNFIKNWQKQNDKNFKLLPNDEHSKLIFHHNNEIIEFIFSTSILRDKCMRSIPKDFLNQYNYMINQENGMTYYKINLGEIN